MIQKKKRPGSSFGIRERALAVLVLLLVWQAAAMALNQRLVLVTPIKVIVCLAGLVGKSEFWQTVRYSFLRIESGFFLALFFGAGAAVLSAAFRPVEILLWPLLSLAKTVPVASFIILALFWLNARSLSVFISFLMVLPVVYFNVLQGMKAVDPRLEEVATVFRMPWSRRFSYIYLPQLRPFLISACATGLGISWKAGIAAEVIGIPDGSIGERLYEAKIYLNTAELFAWTVVVVAVSAAFEKLFMFFLKYAFDRLEQR